MAKNSGIEWTDHTINLWWGCHKVHKGCKNCYAETLSNRFGEQIWGNNVPRKRIKSAFKDLVKYDRQAKKEGTRHKIFLGSMMDIFEDSKPLLNPTDELKTTEDLRNKLFNHLLNYEFENLIFLFLTKRPENITKMIPVELLHEWDNLWFGTSVSDVETVKYAQILSTLKCKNLFLSIEPQVGPINKGDIDLKNIGWVIQGGESGNKKRPFDIQWAYEMKNICRVYSVPYFFKQIDKVKQIPKDLQFREFPKF